MARSFVKSWRILLGALLGLSSAMAYGQSITIQGKVVDANGANITGSTQFRIQILSPDTNHCVLYDESRTLDLTGANGLFSINVGASGGTRVAPTTFSLEQVLSNRGTLGVDGSYCTPTQSGTVNYIPAASDNRKLTIQFQTGSSAWETIPEMDLNPVPFAVDARNLGGYPATQVVRVSSGTAPLLSSADVTALNALLDGTSTKFVSNSSGKGAQLPAFSSDPAGSPAGSVWFDSVSNSLKYRDNSGVVTLGAAVAGGPITSVSGTGGLTGSGSSGAVSLSMASISGVAGSYGSGTMIPTLTVDGYGRITVAGQTAVTGAAPTGAASGDLSGSFPGPTVAKIRGASVSSSAPAAGQFFRFDDKGTPATTDDEWVPVSIRAADLKDSASGSLLPGACAANQVFHFNGLTGGYDCGAIAGITSSQLATSATLPAGGTFRSVTVDTKGLVTAGTNPTTVAAYGITDAVSNLANAKGIAVGTGALPARSASTLNTFYINSSTGAISYDDGSAWQNIAAAPGGFTGALTGDVSGTQSSTSVDKIKGAGVSFSSLSSGNFLRYDGSNWVNAMLAPADLPVMPTAKGGTGLSAAGTADQFLSMKADASGLEYKSLTAGTGVTLTPSAGGLQISAAGTGGTVTNVTAAAPLAVANGNSTPSLSIAKATAAVDGYLDKADFATFAGKLDASATFAGDVSGAYGTTSVDKIKGRGVTYTSLATGNFLKYNGTNWINAILSAADITTGTLSSSLLPAFTGDVTSSAGSSVLTLGTVPTTKGGTGLTAAGTSNQILGMNNAGLGLEYKSFAAGTGVTIGHTANTITINATGTGIATLNGSSASSQAFASPTTVGTAMAWSTASGAHTLNIPLASAGGVAAGLLSNTDYSAFTAKLGTATAFSGDVTGAYNATSVDRLKGNAINNTGLATGQFLKFGASTWGGSTISLADMVNNTGASAMAGAVCNSGQTMYYDTTTKELKCQAISAASISSGILPVANGGTGAATLTSGSLLVGAGTGAVTGLAGGTTGNILTATSATAWTSDTPDNAGLVTKAGAQTISGTKSFSNLITGALQVTGGTIASGRVLTSDGAGNATWQAPAATGVTGSGTINTVPKFTASGVVGNSRITDDGSAITLGTNSASSSAIVFAPSTSVQGLIRMTSDAVANWFQSGVDSTADSKKDIRFASMNGSTTWMAIQGSTGNVGVGTTNPNASLAVNGGVSTKFNIQSANYTLGVNDSFLAVNATSAPITVTLPSAVGLSGREYRVKKIDSSANAVNIATTSSQTIDGASSGTLNGQWNVATFISDGSNWLIAASTNNIISNVQFTFSSVIDASVNSLITSSTIASTGNGSVTITVSGAGSPKISIAGGAWVTSGTITAGQSLAVQLTSSASQSTALTATITAGSFSTNWSVTTGANEAVFYQCSGQTNYVAFVKNNKNIAVSSLATYVNACKSYGKFGISSSHPSMPAASGYTPGVDTLKSIGCYNCYWSDGGNAWYNSYVDSNGNSLSNTSTSCAWVSGSSAGSAGKKVAGFVVNGGGANLNAATIRNLGSGTNFGDNSSNYSQHPLTYCNYSGGGDDPLCSNRVNISSQAIIYSGTPDYLLCASPNTTP